MSREYHFLVKLFFYFFILFFYFINYFDGNSHYTWLVLESCGSSISIVGGGDKRLNAISSAASNGSESADIYIYIYIYVYINVNTRLI